ncbi:MAG: hypothetical protein ACKO1H_16750 [Tabrizicola sp.]
MTYFLQRLSVFVLAALLVFVVAPRLPDVWASTPVWFVLPFSFVITVVFLVAYAVTEAIRAVPDIRAITGSIAARDLLLCLIYLILSAGFLFLPRPTGFSFGDNLGEIIKDGSLTAYGWKVQGRTFFNAIVLAILFWLTFRLVEALRKRY